MDTVREALDTANMWWRVPASTEVDTMLNTVVSEYMSGQTDLETAVQKMKTGIEEALKMHRRKKVQRIITFNSGETI